MIIRTRNVLIPFLALLAAGSCLASSQGDSKEHIRRSLLHKTLVLRNYYKGSNLSYDQNGNLTSSSDSGTWVADGGVLISGARLEGDVLEIRGERVVLYYEPDKRVKGTPADRKVRITISLGANADEDAVTRALQRVFYQKGESGTAPAPPNTDHSLDGRIERCQIPARAGSAVAGPVSGFRAQGSSDCTPYAAFNQPVVAGKLSEREDVYLVTRVITPAKAIHTPDPQYDPGASRDRVQGTVVTSVVIDSLGRIATLQITRSLDRRLDRQAALALSEWRFQPAQRDGKPVASAINIEVRFWLE